MDPVVIWGRAGLLTAVTLFVGVVAHVTADGLLPSPAWLVVLALLLLLPCAALLSQPASALRLVLTLAGGQALVHLVLTVTAGHATAHAGPGHTHTAATPPHAEGAGSALERLQAGGSGATSAGTTNDVLQHVVDHAPMTAVHVLAAVLVGLWLAVGERSLWALLALGGVLLLRPLLLLGALAMAGRSVLRVVLPVNPEPRPPARRLLLARCVVRRGPPLLAI
jgi:hypothetical protein